MILPRLQVCLWILCWITTSTSLKIGNKLGLPTRLLTKWHPINPRQISCHYSDYDSAKWHGGEHVVYLFSADKVESHEKVKLCSAWELVTSCYEHWYFSTDVVHTRRPVKIEPSECLSAWRSNEASLDDLPSDDFPDPSCYWLKTQDATKRVIHMQEIEMRFDYYSNAIVDDRLVNGKCQTHFCYGAQDNFIIIRTPNYQSKCDHWVRRNVMISDHSLKFVDTDGLMYVSSKCDIEFCGHRGKRIGYGLFVAVPSESRIAALSEAPLCSVDKGLIAESPSRVLALSVDNDRAAFDAYQRCLTSRDIIISTQQVTPHMLAQIAPLRSSGTVGEIYRFKNNTLEVATGVYSSVKNFTDDSTKGCAIVDDADTYSRRCFNFKTWIYDSETFPVIPGSVRNAAAMLTNGLTVNQHGQFAFPPYLRWIHVLSIESMQLLPGDIEPIHSEHPVFVRKPSTTVHRVQSAKHFDLSALWNGRWYHKLTWGFIILLLIIITFVALWFILKFIRLRYMRIQYKNQAIRDIFPLNTFKREHQTPAF
ncbi:TPA_asm: G protein [Psilorhabdovirus 2]|nr:TPA_asm: G protein [Psilorhabdovirus 2]